MRLTEPEKLMRTLRKQMKPSVRTLCPDAATPHVLREALHEEIRAFYRGENPLSAKQRGAINDAIFVLRNV